MLWIFVVAERVLSSLLKVFPNATRNASKLFSIGELCSKSSANQKKAYLDCTIRNPHFFGQAIKHANTYFLTSAMPPLMSKKICQD